MKVFLDGEELAVKGASLGTALAAGTAASEEKGRIIVEVWADGDPAPESDLSSPPEREPYASELRFVTAEPKSLVRTVLLDVSDALSATRDTQRQAADHLQVGETGQALVELGDAVRTWETVRRAVEEGCALVNIPTATGSTIAGGGINSALVEDLASNLTSIKKALADQDWPALADLLSFELDEQIDRWQEELNRLADAIKSQS